jgi:hypothetical protein
VDCVARFFVSLYKSDAGILEYFKEDLCNLTENMQASRTQSRQAVIVRCCLNLFAEKVLFQRTHLRISRTGAFFTAR